MQERAHVAPKFRPVEPGDFTRAMGQHVTSVCVITTSSGGLRYGLTATAVSSVCAAPPRLLVCVNKSSLSCDRIADAGHFCVNVLAEDQDFVAKAFAGQLGKSFDRFSLGDWAASATGSPALAGAAAIFDCVLAETIDQFTHKIFLGDIVAVSSQPGQDSLLYGARQFRRLRKIFSAGNSSDGDTLHF